MRCYWLIPAVIWFVNIISIIYKLFITLHFLYLCTLISSCCFQSHEILDIKTKQHIHWQTYRQEVHSLFFKLCLFIVAMDLTAGTFVHLLPEHICFPSPPGQHSARVKICQLITVGIHSLTATIMLRNEGDDKSNFKTKCLSYSAGKRWMGLFLLLLVYQLQNLILS